LTTVLTGLNACLLQAEGYWNVVRLPEYYYFTGGQILGTEYIFNGSGTDITALTLDPLCLIDRGGGDVQPVNEDQLKSIVRPVRPVKNTFEYHDPSSIKQADLQIPHDAIPFDTAMAGSIRTDKYDLATYFPDWIIRGGVTAYLAVETDTALLPETEISRFIAIEGDDALYGGVQFNPIPISAGDIFDFSLQWRNDVQATSDFKFYVRFLVICPANQFYYLGQFVPGTPTANLTWVGPLNTDIWDGSIGDYFQVDHAIKTTDYLSYGTTVLTATGRIEPINQDGILLIEVRGANSGTQSGRPNIRFHSINLNLLQFVNESLQITGQRHTDTGISDIKAIQENSVNIDDSPRNSIAGTLFTDAISNFGYTDINTGENTDIGGIYFTKTTLWHRYPATETLRLGNIITQERLRLNYTARFPVEGTFRNLRYDTDKFISLLTLFQFGFIPGKFFIAASLEIDYMSCVFRAKLAEIFKDDEDDFTDDYEFNYIYKTE
jgi:hypothetical protein